MIRLTKEFYSQSSIQVAPLLLGKYLCRKINNNILKYKITETEAYYGEEDTACHAHVGKTERNKIMYLEGGVAYIYLCYGVHYLFNVVTGKMDFPEAVLIRGVEGFGGPGKLTKALSIDKKLNAVNLIMSNDIWIEYNTNESQITYKTAPRIGINYATPKYKDIHWRFIL